MCSRKHGPTRSVLKRELDCASRSSRQLHYRTLDASSSRTHHKLMRSARPATPSAAVYKASSRSEGTLREFGRPDVKRLCRCASADFHSSTSTCTARDGETKADLAETRKNLRTHQVSHCHLERAWRIRPAVPRLTTKSARHEEVDVKARRSSPSRSPMIGKRLLGYKVSATSSSWNAPSSTRSCCVQEARTRFRNSRRNVLGPSCFYCGLPDRSSVHLRLHRAQRQYLKRSNSRHDLTRRISHPGESRICSLPLIHRRCSTCATNPLRTRRSASRRATRRKLT